MPKFQVSWTEQVQYQAIVEAENAVEAEAMVWGGEVGVVELQTDIDGGSVRVYRVRKHSEDAV